MLGCVCFGWKSLLEMLFRKWEWLVGPENRIFRKLISVDRKKMALTTEIILHFHFHFKVFPEKERERERERARERKKTELQSSPTIVGEPRAPVRVDLANSSPTTTIHRRGALRAPVRRPRSEIVIDGAISRRQDRDRQRDLARSARTGARGSPAIIGLDWSSVFFLSRAHSLSLFFRKYFEVKMKV